MNEDAQRRALAVDSSALPPVQLLSEALSRAVAAAEKGPLAGGNPRVGCALIESLNGDSRIVAVGYHRGAGTAHAEVDALQQRAVTPVTASARLTAVVTLEPCNHTGQTGPCAQALIEAGVDTVVYAVADPNETAAGGANFLRQHGVQTMTAAASGIAPEVVAPAQALTQQWRLAVSRQRPWTIAKIAQTLDGYVAAADGTSQWITGAQAREHAHTVRHTVDAILVGTGTVIADDPALSARAVVDGWQPRPVVIGYRDISPAAQLAQNPQMMQMKTHDLNHVLAARFQAGDRRILVEGGPTLVAAALRQRLVDELHVYVAPILLGGGRRALDDIGVDTLTEALAASDDAVCRVPLGRDELTVLHFSAERETCLPD